MMDAPDPLSLAPTGASTGCGSTGRGPLRRAVVAGGAGFVGSHLCERLLDDGVAVTCVDSFITGSPANVTHLMRRPGFRLVRHDITDGFDISGPVDLVAHLASPASPVDYLRFPLQTLAAGSTGTRNALELATRKHARFLLASTSEVYGDPQVHPQPEDYWGNVNPIGPRSVYDEAKRFSEALTAAYRRARGTDTAIARIFNTYGPRMRTGDGRVVPTFVCQALRGDPLTVAGNGLQTRSLCHVRDTVAGLLALATSPHAGPVNIGGPEETTILALAERIRDLAGSTSPIVRIEAAVDDPHLRRPDTTRARRLLGWQPRTPWEDGLAETIGWFAKQVAA